MKNRILKTCKSTLLLFTAYCLLPAANAQDLPFDHSDKKKFSATIIYENGEEKMVNGYGEMSFGEAYFARPLPERVQNGYTYIVSAKGVNPEKSNEENAGVRFNVTYKDVILGSGTGFDDPTYGQQRRDALNAAFQ